MRLRPDIPALVSGLALLALGGVLMLDGLDAIDLSLEAFCPIAFATLGSILLASGLSRDR